MDNLEPITRNEMFLNGDDLEPITREEMILAGADLEPITRHEWFLKKYRGGGGGGGYDLVNVPNLPADIASFNDGTDLPMASLKVTVTPYQDLHGYDSPWVGGAGKNKFDKSTVNVDKYIGADGQLATSQYNQDVTDFIPVTSGQSYIINSSISTNHYSCFYDANKNVIGSVFANNQFPKVAPSDAKYIRVTFSKADVDTFMVEQGTTASSTYYPYSNICPISGWSDCDINVANAITDPTVEHTYTIDLDGTRYGGTLDVINGVLTVDRVSVTVDENSNIISGSGGLPFRLDLLTGAKTSPSASALTGVKCNFLKEVTQSSSWGVDGTFSRVTTDTKIVYFKVNSEITTIQQLKTFLQSNNLQFVYELATPITVQLAPTPVKSLEGENNISANCGQITEVKYFKRA